MSNRVGRNDCDECGKPLGKPGESVCIAFPGVFHAGDCASRGYARARKLRQFSRDIRRVVIAYEPGRAGSADAGEHARRYMELVCKLVHRLEQ